MIDYQTLAQGRPFPDEIDFRDWMRAYYNDLEVSAPYQSVESKAYQSIVGHILVPQMGVDLEDDETYLDVIKRGITSEIMDEPHSERYIELLMEAHDLIMEYEQLAQSQA